MTVYLHEARNYPARQYRENRRGMIYDQQTTSDCPISAMVTFAGEFNGSSEEGGERKCGQFPISWRSLIL